MLKNHDSYFIVTNQGVFVHNGYFDHLGRFVSRF